MKKMVDFNLETLEIFLDVVGQESSLGDEAWNEISKLNISLERDVRKLVVNYLIPEYLTYDNQTRVNFLQCLDYFLKNGELLEDFPIFNYPYLESLNPYVLFSIVKEELEQLSL